MRIVFLIPKTSQFQRFQVGWLSCAALKVQRRSGVNEQDKLENALTKG
jgi:hypothetical protein